MRLAYRTDGGNGTRARLGLIVLHVDETIEDEFRRLAGCDGVTTHVTRIRSGTELTETTLNAMADRIPAAVDLLPPAAAPDVIGFACTSGATVLGPANVARLIRQAEPSDGAGRWRQSKITDPLTAVTAACQALGLRRLGLVTPYEPSVSAAIRSALEAAELTITAFGSFEVAEERLVARIDPESVYRAIIAVGQHSDCDGVFASCTNLRTLGVLEQAEQRLGRPVISSNQALAWHMLRLAGIDEPRPGCGRLLAR